SENEDHHASKAGRPTCQQALTADTLNAKKDQRSESVLCRPSLDLTAFLELLLAFAGISIGAQERTRSSHSVH
ncbi:hypothetical protein AB4Y40_42765, partial [Paraburkholderia sp. EG287B]|uniref:hypothetical protein n=1 Tax=unclassified Paraburkholderia TaxID=2615204 RepID=UPI0034D21DD1